MLCSVESPMLTTTALARRAGVNRAVVIRLVARGEVVPAGYIEIASEPQPFFPATAPIEVLKLLRARERRPTDAPAH